jgi:2,4-dienoyl-CoA reductase-like NADH-dependent reductase (Old Yellow Enzyme family)
MLDTVVDDDDRRLLNKMFEPVMVGGLNLRNRFVMAPMTRCFSPGGTPGPDVVEYYRRRAVGGVGLIISEGTFVPHAAASHDANIPNFHGDGALKAWEKIVTAVHTAGARIIPQLWHVGLIHKQKAATVPQNYIEAPQIGPSGYLNADTRIGEPMSVAEIEAVVTAFGDAAESALRLGFDGIEVHGAHGYLIDQFLWEGTNRRADHYGGSLKARSQFAAEIVRECRRRTAPNFPIGFRFSQWKQQDYTARLAQSPRELETILAPLVEAGVDVFHCSQRRYWTAEFADSERSLAGWTKAVTGKPAIIVGSVGLDRDMAAAGFAIGATAANDGLDRLVQMYGAGEFDLVAVGRAMVSNPDWCNLIHSGQWRAARPYSSDLLSQLV